VTARDRFWHSVTFGQGQRARVQTVIYWTTPGAAARELAAVRASLVVAAGQGRGLQVATMAAWSRDAMTRHRWRALTSARDRLYAMRQAREARVLRCRVPA